MPNWVYTTIKTDAKNEAFVKEVMGVGGLCWYYRPMPDEILFTNSPNRIISKEEYAIKEALGQTREVHNYITSYYQTWEMVNELKAKYKAGNWDDWANLYWGTKWGDTRIKYDIDGDTMYIKYQSDLSPVTWDIVETFMAQLVNAEYTWEEEQGFGARITYINGGLDSTLEWKPPIFKYTAWLDTMYCFLEEDYENNMGIYEKGWHNYSNWNCGSSLVKDEEVIKKLESIKSSM